MEEKDSNCEEPICLKSDPLKAYQKYSQKYEIFVKADEKKSQKNLDIFKKTAEPSPQHDSYKDCPNSKESLGYFTWNFLHTMAIYYPEKPSDTERTKMKDFFNNFAYFYPCKICAKDLQRDILKSNGFNIEFNKGCDFYFLKNTIGPVRTESRQELSVWVCEIHNKVNLKLGKPLFDCGYENLLKRWKKGFEHCSDTSNI